MTMLLNDLSCAVLQCSVPVKVTRHTSVMRDKGRKQEPLTDELEVLASITPIDAATLQRLPEGQRADGMVLIITTELLFTVETSECNIADQVHYNGIDYQVSQVKDWFQMGGFYECTGTRLQR